MKTKITTETYEQKINDFNIVSFGFDTHARALGIPSCEAKFHWNILTNGLDLKNYSDQNDFILQKQIDTNADSIRQGFEDIKAEIIRNR